MTIKAGIRLTKRFVDQANGAEGRHYLWDDELRGFGVQVERTSPDQHLADRRGDTAALPPADPRD